MSYRDFIENKGQIGPNSGFDPVWIPDSLFPFQVSLDEWAIRKGRAGIFADCGLGKTPMQLDVIDRAVVMWSNKGEKVLTPFMGVGSEVYGAVSLGRRGIGIELKPSYFRQAQRNLESMKVDEVEEADLYAGVSND